MDERSDTGPDDGAAAPTSGASEELVPTGPDELGPGLDDGDETDSETPRPRRRRGRLLLVLLAVAVVASVVAAIFDTPGPTTFAALLLGLVILRTGWFFLQSFATPPPPPPDRGKLRRVRLVYRCNVCGAEVRMTVANDEDPEPPRHCMDDMQLISPID